MIAKMTAINVIEYIIIEIVVQLLKIKPKFSVVIVIEPFIIISFTRETP